MTRTPDDSEHPGPGDSRKETGTAETGAAAAGAPRSGAPRLLLVDMERALLGLLEEWLLDHGCDVVADCDDCPSYEGPFDLVLVDIPFPRRGGPDVLRRLAARYPGTPIFVLSSNFFGGVESTGAVARSLGAACVLPKPLTRACLIAAVEDWLRRGS